MEREGERRGKRSEKSGERPQERGERKEERVAFPGSLSKGP